jgi:hypothetical protein
MLGTLACKWHQHFAYSRRHSGECSAHIQLCTCNSIGSLYAQVGQEDTATEIVAEVAMFFRGKKARSKPLVLLFGGPSGHGKTATAINMASLLATDPLTSCNMVKISCASIRTHVELFGLAGAYQNSEKPSELNAFLRRNVGRRSVVSPSTCVGRLAVMCALFCVLSSPSPNPKQQHPVIAPVTSFHYIPTTYHYHAVRFIWQSLAHIGNQALEFLGSNSVTACLTFVH